MRINLIAKLLIIPLALLSVMGVAIGFTAYYSRQDSVTVLDSVELPEGEDSASKSIEISLDSFYPGVSRSYVIAFSCPSDGDYKLSFTFDGSEEGTLQNFLSAQISIGEEVLFDKLLKEYYAAEEAFSYTAHVDGKSSLNVRISYSMSEDVGDEAQGAVTDFELVAEIERA